MRAGVSEYYGVTLKSTEDLKTAACCTKAAPPKQVRAILARVPAEITSRYYGCGSPFPAAGLLRGRRVVDLGCGTGRDVYVASALVGERGAVIGVDMTEAQLEVGRRHAPGWAHELGFARPNVSFVIGRIEDLPQTKEEEEFEGSDANAPPPPSSVPANWADVIISNCVINLSPDKPAVLRGAFATLAPGGEMHFSDVYCSRRLSRAAREHPVAVGECLGGALYSDDFLSLCRDAGFARPRVAAAREFEVFDAELKEVLGADARFFSVTFRVFKLKGEEGGACWAKEEQKKGGGGCCGGGGSKATAAAAASNDDTAVVPDDAARGFAVGGCQDFGQTATYLGTVEEHPESFELDLTASFEKGKPKRVCAATAAALARTWLAPHFSVTAPGAHRGAFCPSPCGSAGCGSSAATMQRLAEQEDAKAAAAAEGAGAAAKGACGGGKCC